MSNSHDGSAAVSIRFTPIRVVCQNTLSLALEGGSGVLSVRHTGNVAANLAQAQAAKIKVLIDKVFADAENLFGRMVLHKMRATETEQFLEILFPRTKLQKKKGVEPQRWMRIKAILQNEQITPSKTKGTLWALYNAVARDEDYRESRVEAPDRRLDGVWFGSGNDLKLEALKLAEHQMRSAA